MDMCVSCCGDQSPLLLTHKAYADGRSLGPGLGGVRRKAGERRRRGEKTEQNTEHSEFQEKALFSRGFRQDGTGQNRE